MEAEILALGRDAPRAPTEVEFCEIFALSYRRLVVQLMASPAIRRRPRIWCRRHSSVRLLPGSGSW
jgi:hypothetical protein